MTALLDRADKVYWDLVNYETQLARDFAAAVVCASDDDAHKLVEFGESANVPRLRAIVTHFRETNELDPDPEGMLND